MSGHSVLLCRERRANDYSVSAAVTTGPQRSLKKAFTPCDLKCDSDPERIHRSGYTPLGTLGNTTHLGEAVENGVPRTCSYCRLQLNNTYSPQRLWNNIFEL